VINNEAAERLPNNAWAYDLIDDGWLPDNRATIDGILATEHDRGFDRGYASGERDGMAEREDKDHDSRIRRATVERMEVEFNLRLLITNGDPDLAFAGAKQAILDMEDSDVLD